MPPFVARKREASTPPPAPQPLTKKSMPGPKPVHSPATSVAEKKKFLESLTDSENSSLSDIDSDDFEDALHPRQQHSEEEEVEAEWEDAIKQGQVQSIPARANHAAVGEDLELTLGGNEERAALKDVKKKGPSKIERKIRISTHCMHVQFLMYHNALRNIWISDKKVHEILLNQLPIQMKEVVDQWRRDCGDALEPLHETKKTSKSKGKGKAKMKSGKISTRQTQRDWGGNADYLERGGTNMSRADPTLRMLKYLARYWNKAFQVTAPGIRKHGYKSNKALKEQVDTFNKGELDQEIHGERIPTVQAFQDCAKRREGSRDVGAQLFTALCRALGMETRLVVNLQPLGFGWNKLEEANSKVAKTTPEMKTEPSTDLDISDEGSSIQRSAKPGKIEKASKRTFKTGSKEVPVDLDESGGLSDCSIKSEDSVVDVTPKLRKRNVKRYDRDLPFPSHWTEVVSPISFRIYPIDAMLLLAAPATNDEQLALFEPRGTRADKSRQMIAYVVGYSPDGTAKDVTTRYLKRHIWPSKTRGMRLPPEKIPIYNRKGKVKRYEEYDWFKTVMSGYERPSRLRTQVDDIEEATDLKQAKIEKKEVKDGEESLQFYKQSADFVLERLLRREEALLPDAEPVKMFLSGKGDKIKEEPVFQRSDVVACKTEESWHKEGRKPRLDAVPLKHVPIRAVTITRKREIEDLTRRNNGVKPMRGLYSKTQTEYIIPPPIENGVIPKNSYGNMDCFVPSMVPRGAVHIPLRSTARVCKKLGIDYAEAVIGFEFGNKMAVPVIRGVVVAEENGPGLIEAWEVEEQARQVKEDEKRLKLVLSTWRKFLMGLRILDKIRAEIGDDPIAFRKESTNPFMRPNLQQAESEEDLEGGFLRDDEEEDEFGSDLEIIHHGKGDRLSRHMAFDEHEDVPMGGGFITDTPDENADRVFDNSVLEEASSSLSSEEEEDPRPSQPKGTRLVAPKKFSSPIIKAPVNRRSARTTIVKSKYFEAGAEEDDYKGVSDSIRDDDNRIDDWSGPPTNSPDEKAKTLREAGKSGRRVAKKRDPRSSKNAN